MPHAIQIMCETQQFSFQNRICYGVDLNRNWGHGWGGKGASARPCSDTYRGPSAFSEGETFAAKEFLEEKKSEIEMYISFHSFGQFILTPWGNDIRNPYPRDYFDLYNIAIKGLSVREAVEKEQRRRREEKKQLGRRVTR